MASPSSPRHRLRALRRRLTSSERRQAADRLGQRVAWLGVFRAARHIAGYLAFDGEMDPAPILKHALTMGKQVYLPVLGRHPQDHMVFAPYGPDTVLEPNRFGILEPVATAEPWAPPQRLDLVLAPLVAFDAQGNRLGMGGGYYDRTFAFRRHPGHVVRPYLLGLAYEMQKMPELTRQPWDVTLDGVVTEEAFYSFKF